jgi:hypothetical protein
MRKGFALIGFITIFSLQGIAGGKWHLRKIWELRLADVLKGRKSQ